jgi:hypothetical protein
MDLDGSKGQNQNAECPLMRSRMKSVIDSNRRLAQETGVFGLFCF